jgi:hypothetical protein
VRADVDDRFTRYVRVELDGVDVTNDCRIGIEEQGLVELLQRDAAGQIVADGNTGEPAWVTRRGQVVFYLKDDAPAWAVADFMERKGAKCVCGGNCGCCA